MSSQPETHYARSGDHDIAYQVLGDGPLDLLIVPGFVSNVDVQWVDPVCARGLRRLASFARVIMFDKRGTGLSDPTPTVPTLEERMEDVRAVMDAAGSERAALFGYSEGGPMGVMFAATYPERVSGLVMFGSLVDGRRDPVERPWWEESWRLVTDAVENWGQGKLWPILAPSAGKSELLRRMSGAYERACASPAMARALIDACVQINVKDVLPTVKVPSLILHRRDDIMVPVEHGREVAELMPEARYVELPGNDHLWWLGDADLLIDEIEQFLTGARHTHTPERALATVVFTDVVASTERTASIGDRAWRELLERHDALVRREVAAGGGRVIKSMGDGYLAVFDAPGRAIDCAQDIVAGSRQLGVEVRAGVHTGECETLGDDVAGMAVNIGARVSALARPGEVLVSRTVKDLLVGSLLGFGHRGAHTLKGVPGEWHLYAVGEEPEQQEGERLDVPAHVPLSGRALLTMARRTPRLSARLMRGARARA